EYVPSTRGRLANRHAVPVDYDRDRHAPRLPADHRVGSAGHPAHPRGTGKAAGTLVLGAGGIDRRGSRAGRRPRAGAGHGGGVAEVGARERLDRMNPLELVFPNLTGTDYRVTSPADDAYNCLAWAAAESDRWWWPDALGGYYWPAGVPRV